jgi:dihydrodipicolinate synthase/N-acetylneuraminate lyase
MRGEKALRTLEILAPAVDGSFAGDVTSSRRHPPVLLATCPVPWNERHEFDETLFRSTVAHLHRELTPHLYIFGTAGEGHAVTDGQFAAIARAFRRALPDSAAGMVGVISLSLGAIIERVGLARDLGFRQFQLSLPAWGALNDRELERFFQETCGRFSDCSFLHYNLARSRRLLRGDDYARLATAHPNLVAIKMGGADFAAQAEVAAAAPGLQCFFTERSYAALRDATECGLLASISTIHPGRAREFHAARGARLQELYAELAAIHAAMKAIVGDAAHMDGAFDKLYVKLHAPDFPLRLLPPYASTSDEMFAHFRASIPAAWRT